MDGPFGSVKAVTESMIIMMDSRIKYRRLKKGEETRVSEFISMVFHGHVASGLSQEGIDEFMKYIRPDEIKRQLKENHVAFIAIHDGSILGVIEVRNNNHVALFFVDGGFQRRGIGKKLLQKALELCRGSDPEFSALTVNASLNSTMAYETLGFEATDVEQCKNGIRFVPMVLNQEWRTPA